MRSLKHLAVIGLLLAVICVPALAADPAPLPFVKGSWTLVILPDTQRYSRDFPQNFCNQTQWIVDHKEERNIAFVLHEGDICNKNEAKQWENARKAISILDGKVPYALAPGNHDYTGVKKRDTMMSEYFPVDKLSKDPTFGGVFEKGRIESSYHLFSAGGRDWVAIALETFPRNDVVSWADGILKKYPDRSGIIVTHAYLYNDNTRYDYKTRKDQKWSPHGGGHDDNCNDGEEIWQKIVSPNANMAFVFNGHVLGDGAGHLTSTGAQGQTVNQILLNCQSWPDGGSGYLGLVEFLPDGKTVQFKTYSTTLDRYMTDPDHQYVLQVAPAPRK